MALEPNIQSAILAYKNGQKKEARIILESYVEQNPNDISAWYILAHLAQTRQQAIVCFEKVLHKQPENLKARSKLNKLRNNGANPASNIRKLTFPKNKLDENHKIINIILTLSGGVILFLFLILLSLGSGTYLAKAYVGNYPSPIHTIVSLTPPSILSKHLSSTDDNKFELIMIEPFIELHQEDLYSSTPTRHPSSTRNPTLTPRTIITKSSTPTITATQGNRIPESARISGIYGQSQTYSLDCEARSAVDWARHFGISINEKEFFNKLPINDNPDKGFSGSVDGFWGMVPPGPYGIHAEPVAVLLRLYGTKAVAVRGYTYELIRREISSGRPVIAWVVGKVWSGKPLEYVASDGSVVRVAKYEHTVIIIGYNPTDIVILDGANIYKREVSKFQDSWSVLNNMAIIWKN